MESIRNNNSEEFLDALTGVNTSAKAYKLWELLTDIELIDGRNKAKKFIAENPIDLEFLLEFSWLAHHTLKSDEAFFKAMVRLENDPKQLALKSIEQEYETQKTQFKRRGYTMQFVREMASKYPDITSQKTIEKLVAKLNKENEHIPR